jgi:hypothetical protein
VEQRLGAFPPSGDGSYSDVRSSAFMRLSAMPFRLKAGLQTSFLVLPQLWQFGKSPTELFSYLRSETATMLRRSVLLSLLAIAFAYFAGKAWSEPPVNDPASAGEIADLKEQLEKGLQARLPSEFKFIARVCLLVQQGTLPLPLVRSTFTWARRQVVGRKYPFPYFERALRIRAKRIGVMI